MPGKLTIARVVLPWLALALCGCGQRSLDPQQAPYGVSRCNGALGSFDIYLLASPYQGTYRLSIVPVNLASPGNTISVTLANGQVDYKPLVNGASAALDQAITAGPITLADLQTYNIIAPAPSQVGVDFPNVQTTEDAICSLPSPGDGISQQPAQPLR